MTRGRLQKLLPETQSVERARDMIGAIVGLVSLLLALVLGTLIGAAYAFYATQRSEMETPRLNSPPSGPERPLSEVEAKKSIRRPKP